jgi:uncharacterized membrane protein
MESNRRLVDRPAHPAWIVLLIAIAAAGTAMRIREAVVQPIWRDEAQTVAIAQLPDPRAILAALAADGNSPLFSLREHAVVAPPASSWDRRELQDRSLSILFGGLSILMSGLLAWQLSHDRVTSLLAASLNAVSPLAVDLAAQARPYAALTAGTLVLAVFSAMGVRNGRGWIGYAVTAAAISYLHGAVATILIGSFGIALLAATRREHFREWFPPMPQSRSSRSPGPSSFSIRRFR